MQKHERNKQHDYVKDTIRNIFMINNLQVEESEI